MLLFVPPYCRCHDNGRFRFTVIGYGLGLAVTSRFLWTAPYTNEILDVDTSKNIIPVNPLSLISILILSSNRLTEFSSSFSIIVF